MKRIVWIVAALAVVIGGFVWLTVVFSFNAFVFITVFGIVMFLVYRWRSGGELGYFGRKEERWGSAPGWTPPTGVEERVHPRWIVVTTIIVAIAVVGLIAYVLLRPTPVDRYPRVAPHDEHTLR